jgi:hypothetical protein
LIWGLLGRISAKIIGLHSGRYISIATDSGPHKEELDAALAVKRGRDNRIRILESHLWSQSWNTRVRRLVIKARLTSAAD